MTKHLRGPRWAYGLELALALFILGCVIAAATCVAGCGAATTAYGVASVAARATCTVCDKLEELGVCESTADDD